MKTEHTLYSFLQCPRIHNRQKLFLLTRQCLANQQVFSCKLTLFTSLKHTGQTINTMKPANCVSPQTRKECYIVID